MSIISIKGTEKRIVYKLRTLVVESSVTTPTPAERSVSTQQNSRFKDFNHNTTAPEFNSKFEVLKLFWVE